MVDGVAYLSSVTLLISQLGIHSNQPSDVGTNLLDGGAHFYDTYECKDGKFLSVGAIEPQFYKLLLQKLQLDENRDNLSKQMDKENWPRMKIIFGNRIKTKTQSEWASIFEGVDACTFPILSIQEAFENKHNKLRNTFVKSKQFPGLFEASAAPKLSRTKALPPRKFAQTGKDTKQILLEAGFSKEKVKSLLASNHVLAAKL